MKNCSLSRDPSRYKVYKTIFLEKKMFSLITNGVIGRKLKRFGSNSREAKVWVTNESIFLAFSESPLTSWLLAPVHKEKVKAILFIDQKRSPLSYLEIFILQKWLRIWLKLFSKIYSLLKTWQLAEYCFIKNLWIFFGFNIVMLSFKYQVRLKNNFKGKNLLYHKKLAFITFSC